MRACQNGEGVDRPFTGLRRMAALHSLPLHPLFTHPAFARSCHWKLSTSHLGGPVTSVRFRMYLLMPSDAVHFMSLCVCVRMRACVCV